jgi:peptidoglycan hydrolase-like protein with peptidoglycan-binding domain
MGTELNFEAMPFEAYEALASEQSGFELEEELGRRARSRSRRQGFVPRALRVMPKRPGPPPVFRPGRPKKPPVYPPHFPPFPPGGAGGAVDGPYGGAPGPSGGAPAGAPEPYGAAPEPYPAEPVPAGSEYMRWVQSALNDVLGLRLPVHGVADPATRSAIRSFQQREGLPVDGVVGPDTERALIAARRGQSSRRGATEPTGSGMAEPPEPAAAPSRPDAAEPIEPAPEPPAKEFSFEWKNFEDEFDELQALSAETPMAWEAPKGGPANRPKPQMTCPIRQYDKGEVQKSRTAQGHLTSDVIVDPRGLLIADFEVDVRTPRESLKRNGVLQGWLRTMGEVIRANPATEIRILGFSDCVGNERNNTLLRRGRAVRVPPLLNQMLGNGPQWNSIKSKITFTDGAPPGKYLFDNNTAVGRAKNRSVLIEHKRYVPIEGDVVKARPRCVPIAQGLTTSALSRLIPDDPDYRKHVPLNYRLNAKKIVEELSKDLKDRGKSARFWTELAKGLEAVHGGIVVAEMFELGGALAIAAPLLAAVGVFLGLGAPYLELAEEAAAKGSALGFSRGVVMGANGRSAKMVQEYFGNQDFPKNPWLDRGPAIARANYRVGLLAGYAQGRVLCPTQRAIFWRDLGRRMGDQSQRGPQAKWTKRDWFNWYDLSAEFFRRDHL